MITITYGIACGWPSPTVPILGSEETPIESGPLTSDELSWVVGMMCFGGFTGTLLIGWITDRIGRKYPLWILAIPSLV